MNGQQLFDLLTDLQNDGLNLSEIHLAYPSQNPITIRKRIDEAFYGSHSKSKRID
jgi:hypothetical protein